jgi:hypothetical protein
MSRPRVTHQTDIRVMSVHEYGSSRLRLSWEVWRAESADPSVERDVPYGFWTRDPTAADTARLAMRSSLVLRVTWHQHPVWGAQMDGCEILP